MLSLCWTILESKRGKAIGSSMGGNMKDSMTT